MTLKPLLKPFQAWPTADVGCLSVLSQQLIGQTRIYFSVEFYHMLAAHAESSINGLGYWLGLLARPREQLRDCLLLEVNAQGRLMYCTVL